MTGLASWDGEGPCFERFVAGLPDGLDSYPQALAKGSLVRSALLDQPREVLAALPPPLRPWVDDPPFDNHWVSEARFGALVHAIAERRGFGEAACVAWTRRRNVALLSGPLYRVLMGADSPAAMLRRIELRWTHFHRGSTLAFEGFSDDGARLSLAFPAGIFDRLLLRSGGAAIAAALEVANARGVVVELEHAAEGFARYRARW